VTRKRARHLLDHGIAVTAFVDIDPDKIGRAIGSHPVIPPTALPAPGTSFIVSYVSGTDARDEIEATLRTRGYRPGLDYVLAA